MSSHYGSMYGFTPLSYVKFIYKLKYYIVEYGSGDIYETKNDIL